VRSELWSLAPRAISGRGSSSTVDDAHRRARSECDGQTSQLTELRILNTSRRRSRRSPPMRSPPQRHDSVPTPRWDCRLCRRARHGPRHRPAPAMFGDGRRKILTRLARCEPADGDPTARQPPRHQETITYLEEQTIMCTGNGLPEPAPPPPPPGRPRWLESADESPGRPSARRAGSSAKVRIDHDSVRQRLRRHQLRTPRCRWSAPQVLDTPAVAPLLCLRAGRRALLGLGRSPTGDITIAAGTSAPYVRGPVGAWQRARCGPRPRQRHLCAVRGGCHGL